VGLRFFADQCVPMSVVEILCHARHDVLLLKQYIPMDSPDSVVISTARNLDAILLSLNGDFSDIVAYPPHKYNGIICLQTSDKKPPGSLP